MGPNLKLWTILISVILIQSCASAANSGQSAGQQCDFYSLQEIAENLSSADGKTFCGETYLQAYGSNTFVADQPIISLSNTITFVPVVQDSANFIYELDHPTPVRIVATIDVMERCFPDDFNVDFSSLSCVPVNYPVELIVRQLTVDVDGSPILSTETHEISGTHAFTRILFDFDLNQQWVYFAAYGLQDCSDVAFYCFYGSRDLRLVLPRHCDGFAQRVWNFHDITSRVLLSNERDHLVASDGLPHVIYRVREGVGVITIYVDYADEFDEFDFESWDVVAALNSSGTANNRTSFHSFLACS